MLFLVTAVESPIAIMLSIILVYKFEFEFMTVAFMKTSAYCVFDVQRF
jgi:hypothetical protein